MTTLTLIDDDHTDLQLLSIWCEQVISSKVMNRYYSGIDAIKQDEIKLSDICIIDLRMPLLSGIETTILLFKNGYTGKVLLVSHGYYHEDLMQCKAVGAHGYCRKEEKTIVNSLIKLRNNEICYEEESYKTWQAIEPHQKLMDKDTNLKANKLNLNHRKILLYSCKGLSTEQMSELMGLKKHTVEQYRAAMLKELEFKNIGQATAWAIACNVISPSTIFTPSIHPDTPKKR